jgi:hypothetical protein
MGFSSPARHIRRGDGGPILFDRRLNLGIYLIGIIRTPLPERVAPIRNSLEQKGKLRAVKPLCRIELEFIPQSLAELYSIPL